MWRICDDERECLRESNFPDKAMSEALAELRAVMYTQCFKGCRRTSTEYTGDELTADDLQAP